MRDTDLLQMALGLLPPWMVAGSTFDATAKRLDIHLDFPRGSRFACPDCGSADCPAYDTEEMMWRHLNFFQHEAYLHARVPRVRCPGCGVKRVSVAWARDGSGFTLLFEAIAMTMMTSMPVAAVGRLMGEHDTRLWRVLHHYVDEARGRADYSGVTRVAFDETAARRGHDYVSLFVDLDGPRVLFVANGKDAATVEKFAVDLADHGGAAENVAEVCIDMSAAFIKGTAAHLPNADITFDKFHAVKIINDAVDLVRRAEQKDRPELKKTRYIWLKNKGNLTEAQLHALGGLADLNLKTARAYQIRLTFQDVYAQPSREAAEAFLKKWYFWATHSRLKPNFRTLGSAGGGRAQKRVVFGARVGNVVLNDDLSLGDYQPIVLTYGNIVWCPWRETRMPRHVRSRQEDRWLRVSVPRREYSRGRPPCAAGDQGAGPAR